MAVFNGTDQADTYVGTAENDVINGVAGNDTLNGAGGNDVIQGGAGDDQIDGGAGADTMIGDAGNDTFLVDDQADQVTEAAGGGNDTVLTSASFTLSADQQIEILRAASGTAAINLTGNNQAQQIEGNAGNNTIDGGVDVLADTLVGGIGDDTYLVRASDSVLEINGQGNDRVFAVGSHTLTAGQSVEFLSAADAAATTAATLVGNEFTQTIVGNAGANIFSGSTTTEAAAPGGSVGADTFVGLGGNDEYHVVNTTQVVTEAAGGGTDEVQIGYFAGGDPASPVIAAAGTYTIGANVETVDASRSAGVAINVVATSGNENIIGNDAANRINGGGGTDTMSGGNGGDTYISDGGDTITDAVANTGTDILITSAATTLASDLGLEQVHASGSLLFQANGAANTAFQAAFDTDGTRNLTSVNTTSGNVAFLNGNATAQQLWGDAGANIIDGNRNAGLAADAALNVGPQFADTLSGLGGDDTYRVYEQGDVVLEDRDAGFDRIFTSGTYSLVANDTAAQTALTGVGGVGTEGFYTTAQIEFLSVAAQNSTDAVDLTGNAYGNYIAGNYGANILTGGGTSAGGVDVLIGLRGDDTYFVDSVNTFVFDNDGEGTDTVTINAAASGFTLNAGAYVETLTAAGTGDIVIVGNGLSQTINGNAGNNTLSTGGGTAPDTLQGGLGDDTYRVFSAIDTIVEATGAGNDRVFTSGNSYALTAGVEVEYVSASVQAGTEAIYLVGNQLEQVIVGNYGNNILDSGQGAVTGQTVRNQAGDLTAGDTLIGLFGNDVYRVYSSNDVIQEADGQGTDSVFTSGNYTLAADVSVETLSTENQASTTATLTLTGNNLSQTVIGNQAANTIDGGAGADTLTGLGGSDTFAFTTALGTGNVDTLSDFAPGDFIGLAAGIFAAATDNGGIAADEFYVMGSGTQTADQSLVYNQSTGQLFYDADGSGSGAAVLFAQLAAGTGLGFNDFAVYAPPAPVPVV